MMSIQLVWSIQIAPLYIYTLHYVHMYIQKCILLQRIKKARQTWNYHSPFNKSHFSQAT